MLHHSSRLIFFALLVASFHASAEQTILFADSPYPPYVLGDQSDKEPKGGTAIDLVNQLFTELPDYNVQFRLLPWKRVLRDLESGAADGVTMVAITPEREQFLDFSAALVNYQLGLFYSASRFPEGFEWQDFNDLSEYRIGVVEGYLSDSKLHEFVEQGAPLKLVRLSGTEQQLFGMLLKGRVDLICFKLESGKTLLRQQQWAQEIFPNKRAIYKGSYHLGFSKAQQHGALISQLNQIINLWRENGKVDAILHPHSPH